MPAVARRRFPMSRSAIAAALGVLLLGALPAGPMPGSARAEEPLTGPAFVSGPIPVSGTVTFYGRGSGHGVGMSQYGARGRALAGQDAPTILAHYYQNTTLTTIDPATPVRVLLVSGFAPTATRPARVVALDGPWTIDGLDGAFPPGGAVTLERVGTTWLATVTGPDGVPLATLPASDDLRVRPAAPETRLGVSFKSGAYNLYRGVVRLLAATRISAINEIGMDDYLLGVVPVEMSYLWPFEALRAQAIAARTYALKRLHPAVGRWDVYDDSRSQVYRGVRAERTAVTQAVLATAGQVLMVGAAVANTPFHSSGGGATENNEFVWTRSDGTVIAKPSPELRGSSDRAPDGTPYDAGSSSAAWHTATYGVDRLSAMLGADPRTNVGLITAIDLSQRGVSGRLIAITLIGTAGTKTVAGSVFRSIFNARRPSGHPLLRSTLIDLVPIP